MSEKDPKNKLNPRQQEAVEHGEGPLLIAAGAGSGKTKTLTSRIACLVEKGVAPENILAITFTNKAAEEMKKRINNNRLPASTFHSFGAKILRQEHSLLNRQRNFTIFDDDDALAFLKKVLLNRNLSKDKFNPLKIRYRISKVKEELAFQDIEDELFKNIFADYEKALEENNGFDFDDLIEKPVRIFLNYPTLLKRYQDQYHYVLIDEYQDINTAQYHLVRLLAQKHRNLNVVGDDAQSIYAFRGSDFRNFLNFEKDWPQTKVVFLEENYRSTGKIIQAANEVIKNNKQQKQKTLWTKNEDGEDIRLYPAQDDADEAYWIAEKIPKLDLPLDQITILYRTNAQSRAIEQALIATGIPYRIFGGIKFYERKEIKDIIAGLRFANNPQDSVSIERLKKLLPKSKSGPLLIDLPRLAQELTTVQLINYFLNNTDYSDYLERNFKNSGERLENVKELVNFAKNFADKGLNSFLEQVSLAQQTDLPAGEKGVNLMTIHLSKGLEFDAVFLCGCSEGIMPHQRSLATDAELEEERRLMYVAMTRAAKKLFISFTNIPSRFLYEIPQELVNFEKPVYYKNKYEEDAWIEYD